MSGDSKLTPFDRTLHSDSEVRVSVDADGIVTLWQDSDAIVVNAFEAQQLRSIMDDAARAALAAKWRYDNLTPSAREALDEMLDARDA